MKLKLATASAAWAMAAAASIGGRLLRLQQQDASCCRTFMWQDATCPWLQKQGRQVEPATEAAATTTSAYWHLLLPPWQLRAGMLHQLHGATCVSHHHQGPALPVLLPSKRLFVHQQTDHGAHY